MGARFACGLPRVVLCYRKRQTTLSVASRSGIRSHCAVGRRNIKPHPYFNFHSRPYFLPRFPTSSVEMVQSGKSYGHKGVSGSPYRFLAPQAHNGYLAEQSTGRNFSVPRRIGDSFNS